MSADTRLRLVGYAAAALLIVLLPSLAPNPFYVHLGQIYAYTAIAVIGLNILLGLSGQMSLGHGGFYAIGCYATAILATTLGWPIGLTALAGLLLTLLAGLAVGMVALRTRGLYLAMATLAFGFIVEILAQRWVGLTGGTMGLMAIPQIDFGNFAMGPTYFFWVAAGLLLLCQIGSDYLFGSATGRRLRAIKESEAFAQTVGLNVPAWRIGIFAASAVFAGLAGILFAHQSGFVSSDAFNIRLTIGLLIAAVIGGLGNSWGPLLGTAVLLGLTETIASLHQYGPMIYGSILLAVLLLVPEGLVGLFRRLAGKRRQDAAVETAPARPAYEIESAQPRDLVVEGLSKNYAGVSALTTVSLSIAPGQVHALIGPNGAGKSTFINVVAGLYRPSAGRILLGGEDVTALAAHQRARLGLVRTFQNLQLIGGVDVLANVMLGMRARDGIVTDVARWFTGRGHEAGEREEALAILELVGLGPYAHHLPKDLAYGHRKLVELARAIAQRPSVLLLDEPVAGLNPLEAQAIAGIVRRLKEAGITVLVVEHNMDFVMGIADTITVLDFGHAIAAGLPAAIQADPAVLRAYLGQETQAA
ncbi:ABC transporter permease subunit [Enterovirga rhinocerotis]|uniref:Amino acid/amide ABC transporter membrane protein 2 (HAAT family) /amino acid/amide ABC transporter ATP-binding protein 1 (HAAT family) n=1 Tax=Enterovirga rhinocerotis TaxID=1339210 RepID=A0A4R7C578_9HYPH|nr:branched-chain amino acid ABC transporter ATP-binding protein/permease [Enterovirga rhinocerotis]TDR93311.1 amino acid/amide ABC transporter membrane protein 2 (HAAT family) /amino acid/amide ABC transporter ATP-binding protein 1 (HAAT family) [Enterovirga rhinocerotis]